VSDVPADLQTAFADRYDLQRLLGRGGMASVYLGWDRKHHREVALKVLRPDLAASLGAERFLKEIQIAARLNHPHILALYDSGEAGGFLYYVMPHVEGGSLRQLLERERRLEPDRALAIAAPVADALCYAHRTGVFHRDIKPENILFQQGHPIVADFGIAKAISTAGGANLTRTGFPLGTPGYMSPEQAAGLSDLDERTDVYSLGVVVYEMLVGETPGRWPTEDAVRAGRFLEAPSSHRARLAQVGPVLEGALVRALAIRHDQRTASPDAFVGELTGSAAPRRRYSGGEVQEIVRRASEIEAAGTVDGDVITIGGVQQIAGAVGIPTEAVRLAARSLEVRSASVAAPPTQRRGIAGWAGAEKPNWWLGAPTELTYERRVDGEMPDAEFPTLVNEIRDRLRNAGQVSQLGHSFTWVALRHPSSGGRDVQVTVAVRAGTTRISVREGLGPLAAATFGGIGGGVGAGGLGAILPVIAAVFKAPGAIVAVIPLWIWTVFAVSRTSYYYGARRRDRQLSALADRLAALAEEVIPRRPALP
jgi:hypothetical protein